MLASGASAHDCDVQPSNVITIKQAATGSTHAADGMARRCTHSSGRDLLQNNSACGAGLQSAHRTIHTGTGVSAPHASRPSTAAVSLPPRSRCGRVAPIHRVRSSSLPLPAGPSRAKSRHTPLQLQAPQADASARHGERPGQGARSTPRPATHTWMRPRLLPPLLFLLLLDQRPPPQLACSSPSSPQNPCLRCARARSGATPSLPPSPESARPTPMASAAARTTTKCTCRQEAPGTGHGADDVGAWQQGRVLGEGCGPLTWVGVGERVLPPLPVVLAAGEEGAKETRGSRQVPRSGGGVNVVAPDGDRRNSARGLRGRTHPVTKHAGRCVCWAPSNMASASSSTNSQPLWMYASQGRCLPEVPLVLVGLSPNRVLPACPVRALPGSALAACVPFPLRILVPRRLRCMVFTLL